MNIILFIIYLNINLRNLSFTFTAVRENVCATRLARGDQLSSPVSDEQAGRKNNHHDIIPKLCLYDRFHETNTVKEAEILRRVTLSPHLNGLVNTQVAEQLHRSTVRSKVFLLPRILICLETSSSLTKK